MAATTTGPHRGRHVSAVTKNSPRRHQLETRAWQPIGEAQAAETWGNAAPRVGVIADEEMSMIDWWTETDDAIIESLRVLGPTSPEELARRVGLSVGDVSAFLAMLVREDRVRIRSVDLTPEENSRLDLRQASAFEEESS